MFHLICFAYTKLAAHPNEDITGDDAYPPNIRYRERDDINHNGIDELDGENKTLEPVSLPDHHGFNFSLYETEDPGFLVVSAAKPDHAFTIYNTPSKSRTIMPVNLGLVTVAMLKYQIFHAYYRKSDMGVWFEWESTSKEDGELEMDTVMVIASGLEIHATRTLQESDLNFFVEEVKGSNFFRIKSGDKCLNVSDVINESRQSYPLVFKICDDSLNQEFALVSVMKTVCKLGIESLCGGDEQAQITNAQRIVQKKLSSLFTDRYR